MLQISTYPNYHHQHNHIVTPILVAQEIELGTAQGKSATTMIQYQHHNDDDDHHHHLHHNHHYLDTSLVSYGSS